MRSIATGLTILAVVSSVPLKAHSQDASAPAASTPATKIPFADGVSKWQVKNRDFTEFEDRLFDLLARFDRKTTSQADIEAIMGIQLLPDAKAKSFEMPPLPGKQVAAVYKNLGVQQYTAPFSQVFERKLPEGQADTLVYGFENNGFDFPYERDKCLSLNVLKAHFPTDSGWHKTNLGMFYFGLAGQNKRAQVSAFIDKDSFYLPPEDEKALDKITKDENWQLNPKKAKRVDELLSHMDGCVFILDIF